MVGMGMYIKVANVFIALIFDSVKGWDDKF